MKALLTLLTLLFAQSLVFAMSNAEIKEHIEKSDSIPVYLLKSNITPPVYMAGSTRPPLNHSELNQKAVNAELSDDADSIQKNIVSLLNQKYGTSKFYAASSGEFNSIRDEMNSTTTPFVVELTLKAAYSYNNQALISRVSVNKNQPKQLQATINLILSCRITFKEYNAKKKRFKKVEKIAGGSGTNFKMTGYSNNANTFIRLKDPLSLSTDTLKDIESKMAEL